MSEKNEGIKSTLLMAKSLMKLYVDDMAFLAIEKVSIILSRALMMLIFGGLGICALFFISIALILILSLAVPKMWCYLIMGGVYIVIGVLVFIFRDVLITNHITRFLSKLFLDEPVQKNVSETSVTKTEQ